MEQEPRSTKELFKQILNSPEPRDLLKDGQKLLELEGIDFCCEYIDKPQPNTALIITPNHFLRPLRERGLTVFTSKESFVDSSIVTVAADQGYITWVVKQLPELSAKIGPIRIPIRRLEREAQNAFARVYGVIQLPQKLTTRDEVKNINNKLHSSLENGIPLGVFPEEHPSRKLRAYYHGCLSLLRQLRGLEYNIWPVSIFTEGRKSYRANFGKVITVENGQNSQMVAEKIMNQIASGLPYKLKGQYSI